VSSVITIAQPGARSATVRLSFAALAGAALVLSYGGLLGAYGGSSNAGTRLPGLAGCYGHLTPAGLRAMRRVLSSLSPTGARASTRPGAKWCTAMLPARSAPDPVMVFIGTVRRRERVLPLAAPCGLARDRVRTGTVGI